MPTSPPSISALPPAPDPNNRSTFNSLAYPWSAALPTFGTQVSAVAANVKANADEAAASATSAAGYVSTVAASAAAAAQSVTDASTQVSIAQGAAQNKGNWSALAGALAMPASVVHSGRVWVLRANLANVTTSEPGLTADWLDITPATTAYACNQDQALITLTGAASTSVYSLVVVDSTRTLLLLQSSSAVHAVCYNSLTKTFGAAVLVRSVSDNARPFGVLAATDRVLVASCPGSTAFEAVVLSLAGTTITVGTAATRTLVSACFVQFAPVAVGSAYVFVLRDTTAGARGVAITVSGTTATVGTDITLLSAGGFDTRLLPVSASVCLAIGTGGGNLQAIPVSVSGTTLTLGTAATTTGTQLSTAVALASGRFACIYTATATRGAIASVSGTVATLSTVALGTGASLGVSGVKVGEQIVVASEANSVNVLTDAAGTATAGTAVTIQTMANYSGPVGFGTDYASFLYNTATNVTYYTIKISGNNPVLADVSISTIGGVSSSGSSGYGADSTGKPNFVLSTGIKSGVVIPAATDSAATAARSVGLQFGSSVRAVLLPTVPNNVARQSDSVLFAGGSAASSANIRIHRLELV